MNEITIPVANISDCNVEVRVFDIAAPDTSVENVIVPPGESHTVTLGPGRCISTFVMVPGE